MPDGKPQELTRCRRFGNLDITDEIGHVLPDLAYQPLTIGLAAFDHQFHATIRHVAYIANNVVALSDVHSRIAEPYPLYVAAEEAR